MRPGSVRAPASVLLVTKTNRKMYYTSTRRGIGSAQDPMSSAALRRLVVLIVLAATTPTFGWGRKQPDEKKSSSKIPVIIIADVGIDDAGALLLAVGSAELNVLGVVSSFGCHKDPRVTARNAHALLAAANRTDVPIFLGASYPIGLDGPLEKDGTHFHGAEGLGNLLGLGDDIDQTCNSEMSTDMSGAEFIVKRARSIAGGEHVLCKRSERAIFCLLSHDLCKDRAGM